MAKKEIYIDDNGRKRVRTVYDLKKQQKAVQSDESKANIHNILDRFKKTGMLTLKQVKPIEGDVPNVESYHEAMNVVTAGKQKFAELPVKIREQFKNDPGKFLEFVNNPENQEKLYDMGLATRPSEVDPIQVTVVSSEPSPDGSEADTGTE